MGKKRASKKILPRMFRLVGRVLLSAGVVLGVGVGALLAYEVLNPGSIGGKDIVIVVSEGASGSPVGSSIKTSNVIWAGIILVVVSAGLVLTIRQLNGFVRKSIVKIAGWLNWSILSAEIVLSLVAWALSAILMYFWIPAGTIMSAVFLVATVLCFVLAWLLYKRPKYKL